MNNINKGIYEGYYWMSNEKKPITLDKEPFEQSLNPAENPFVVEAQLFDSNQLLSYSIRFVDGEYLVKEFTLLESELNPDTNDIERYIPQRIEAAGLNFLQRWKEEPDEYCENMLVLKPAEMIFIGFNHKEERK